MALDKVELLGRHINVGRPKGYIEPPEVTPVFTLKGGGKGIGERGGGWGGGEEGRGQAQQVQKRPSTALPSSALISL